MCHSVHCSRNKRAPWPCKGYRRECPAHGGFHTRQRIEAQHEKARSEMKQNALFEKLKKEIYPAVRKDVEESMMMMLKTLTLIDSHQMGGEAGMEDAAYCATTPHKSSCASAHPCDTETVAAH